MSVDVAFVSGDWHFMKTAAEVLNMVLNDGGFKVFTAKCGHKGDITQWQDIHNNNNYITGNLRGFN